MFRSLRSRLSIIFVSLAIVPVLIVSSIVALRSFNTLEAESLISEQETARYASSQINAFLQERQNELQLLIEVEGLENLSPDAQEQLLNNLLSYRQVYFELTLLDGSGQELMRLSRRTSVGASELVSRAESDEFRFVSQEETLYASPVRFDPIAGEPLMSLALPLIDLRTGVVSAVLVADFRFQRIWDLIAGIELNGSEDVYLLDASGAVIAHQNPSIVLQNTVFQLPATNGRAVGLSGSEVLLARETIQIQNQEFVVVAERPISEALELATSGLIVTAVITFIALLAAIALVILTVRQIVLPIERLSTAARSIREGKLETRVQMQREDEIGELGRSFNSMSEQLSELINKLEERVEARTRDLRVAADVSRQITTVLDRESLLPQLTEDTRNAFDLYHVSVFLYYENEGLLKLEAGTGTAGQVMRQEQRGFRLDDSKGLVAKAAKSQAPVVVNDVSASPEHLANPLLPETRSEIALPMMVGTSLVGVLDLQSKDANRFQAEDIAILKSLAEQISIAVRNADLYAAANLAREEAERANSVKSQFLAAMSHELRTPLNGIINFTGFVADEMLGEINERQKQFLNDAIINAEHLLALINDVLDISKIEAGSLKLFVEDNINLAEEIQTIARTGETLLIEKDVKLQLEIAEDLPLLRGDKRRIRQIVLNLVSNACKFTDEGSVTIKASQANGEILIAVKDTGPGIAGDDHEKVFETFLQTEAGLRKGGGTGLGLPISRKLAEAHGGRLWVESALGAGAVFYVSLPVSPS